MCITRYLLVHGLCEVCLYELHLESGGNYCCITAVSVESDMRGENIVYLLLWLLCQPGEKTGTGAVPVSSVQFSCSVVSSSLQPQDFSMPGFSAHHQCRELFQTHVHWVGDVIQPSHPPSSTSPLAFNLSQHQGIFQWVSSSHQVAKVLEFQLKHQSFQWIFRTDFL